MKRTLITILCMAIAGIAIAQNDFKKNIEAAKKGDSKAQHIIGCCYEEGNGVEKNTTQAIYWWRKAAEQGEVYSQHNIGVYYLYGIGVSKDHKEGYLWIRKAAEQGLHPSQYELGVCYENGYGVNSDINQAFIWYKKSAEQGYADAQFQVGYMYDTGEGVSENRSKAIEWYRKAANQGYSQALNNLGCLFRDGDGAKQDYAKALDLFKKSANQNNSNALFNLGCMYRDGKGVKQDYAKASEYFLKSADLGDSEAMIKIAFMYESGLGVKKDINNAIEWYKKAAELGNYTGDWNLGTLYFKDNQLTKAAEWYYKGATKGDADCQESMGSLYYHGWGLDKNYKEAIKWMSLAASQGNEIAQETLNKWKSELPYEYFASAEKFTPPVEQMTQVTTSNQVKQANALPDKNNTKEQIYISDVDQDMPLSRTTNRNIFAIVIGNENYKNNEGVPYACRDSKTFSDYVENTLGVPKEQIKHIEDATYNDIRIATNWIINAMKVCRGKGKAIIYYAGHGIPNESGQSAYLLPVDGIGNDTNSAFSLDELYEKLSNVEAQSITVFLDACFSGSKREEGMLTSARGVAIKVKPSTPKGNLIIFSAAQGDETAYPYKDKQHGLFTYYLLKKLQESKGEATLGELSEYLTDEVGRQSFLKNNKIQTPTVIIAPSLQNTWKNLKLK